MAKKLPSIKDLIDAGAHFGHLKDRWNPKMKRFIFELRGGVYIIDLAKTMEQLRKSVDFVSEVVKKHKGVLFVGTKKQAKTVIRECAESCGENFVCERWLGGMLTNLSTIKESIKKLSRIEQRLEAGGEGLTKKELSQLNKDRIKLDKNLCGIREMRKLPGLVVVVDPKQEHLAVAEARKLGIPVMALVDTNCDPDPVDFVIPGNDDALKCIRLIIQAISDAIVDTKTEMEVNALKSDRKQDKTEEAQAEEPKLLEADSSKNGAAKKRSRPNPALETNAAAGGA